MTRIARAAYAPYATQIGRPPAPMTADYNKHLAQDVCFVAFDARQVLAFAILIEKSDGWWLETIATDPKHQGGGAGTALIAYIEAFLAPRTDLYRLYTNVAMTAAYAWYGRQGFTEKHRSTQDGFSRIFMVKTLSRAAPT